MKDMIETWKVIVLLVQCFCLGGSLFSENEMSKTILRAILGICFLIALVGF